MKISFPGSMLSHARTRSRSSVILLASLALATIAATPAARANDYPFTFSISGNGVTASGTFDVSSGGVDGSYKITDLTGTFSDAGAGISTTTITGLEDAGTPILNPPNPPVLPAGTFSAPSFTANSLFSYDNLFWIDGNSPAVCADALFLSGGYFDIYGVVFDLSDGNTVDLWSQGSNGGGYFLNNSATGGTTKLHSPDDLPVSFSVAQTPEPSSFLLLGTGLLGSIGAVKRRFKSKNV